MYGHHAADSIYCAVDLAAPRTFDYSELFWDMMVSDTVTDQPVDFVLLFVHNKAELEAHLAQAKTAVKPDGKLWIAYPKGSQYPVKWYQQECC